VTTGVFFGSHDSGQTQMLNNDALACDDASLELEIGNMPIPDFSFNTLLWFAG
jgi:hypothetical protein